MTQPPVAIVTGASRAMGIGAAIARQLARQGIAVFTSYYRPFDAAMAWGSNPNEATELLAELREVGVSAEGQLLVEQSDGRVEAVSVGDVTLREVDFSEG